MVMRRFLLAGLVLALGLSAGTPRPAARSNQLPSRLSDRDFWRLVVDSSERDGYFRSDNIVTFLHLLEQGLGVTSESRGNVIGLRKAPK